MGSEVTEVMKLPKLALLLCYLLTLDPCSGLLPFGEIVKDTLGAVRGIQENIRNKIKSRERPPNPVEVAVDVKDALIEDYVQNSGKRIEKMCQYLKQGRIYQGPCPQDQRGGNVGGGGDGYETSETRQYEQPNRGYDAERDKYRQGGRGDYGSNGGGRPPPKVVVVEEETRVVPDVQPGYDRPQQRQQGNSHCTYLNNI